MRGVARHADEVRRYVALLVESGSIHLLRHPAEARPCDSTRSRTSGDCVPAVRWSRAGSASGPTGTCGTTFRVRAGRATPRPAAPACPAPWRSGGHLRGLRSTITGRRRWCSDARMWRSRRGRCGHAPRAELRSRPSRAHPTRVCSLACRPRRSGGRAPRPCRSSRAGCSGRTIPLTRIGQFGPGDDHRRPGGAPMVPASTSSASVPCAATLPGQAGQRHQRRAL